MRAPLDEITAPSFKMASSYKAATGAFRLMWILSMSKPACEKYSTSLPMTDECQRALSAPRQRSGSHDRLTLIARDSSVGSLRHIASG